MGLTRGAVEQHISGWVKRLERDKTYPYRWKWPRFLFRHEPLENAVLILRSGNLLSRHEAGDLEHVDIAPPGIILNRREAHHFARLYFRPRTPTQYRVEGIRKKEELYRSENADAPVLVMFIFRAGPVLTMEPTGFSDGNMQSQSTRNGFNEGFFKQIDFESVYHDGSFDPATDLGKEILRKRCAEVLAPSPLPLEGTLYKVLCRSEAERQALLYRCPLLPGQMRSKVLVATEPGLFESRYTYVRSIDMDSSGLSFRLNPRRDGRPVEVSVEVRSCTGTTVVQANRQPVDPARKLRLSCPLGEGRYRVQISLEGHLAYENELAVTDAPF